MTAAVPLLSPLRVSRAQRAALQRLLHGAPAQRLGSPPLLPEAMLARAVQDHRTNGPAKSPLSKSVVNNTTLQKQLFPSSSPVSTQSGDIVNQLKKAARPASFLGRRDTPASVPRDSPPISSNPLAPRSGNFARSHASRGRNDSAQAENGMGLAALYTSSDSFKEVVDGFRNQDIGKPAAKAALPVYFEADDFSDDENLDLDYACPSALPSLPTQSSKPVTQPEEPIPGSGTSGLSWSQSSPSHYLPPQRRHIPSTKPASKRASPVEEAAASAPVAKKRTFPKHWQSSKDPVKEETDNVKGATTVATPRPTKSGESMPWNTTASAVKEQKRQLKGQSKKQSAPGGEASADEPRAATASHGPAKSAAIALSNEQCHVKNLVCTKNASVFFTGPAGTGKSVLMRAIIQELKKKWTRDPERLAVTASTGLAACNIGGMTLHSFAGIGLGKEDAQTLVKKIRRNPKAKNRWLRTKTLIIDEVSMVDGELFDKLSQIGRILRNNGRPWGGIQLVITGDFFQLPPVPDGDKTRDVKFAFEAATWATSIDHTIGLTEVFRQKDPDFAQMLNEMRLGRISEQTVQSFKSLSRPLRFDDGLEVTELFPTRSEVDGSNERRLRALVGKSFRYDAYDTGDPIIRDKLLQNMMAPKALELKKGAQVMLIKNMDETLVNGSLGTVVGFMSQPEFDLLGGAADCESGDEMDPEQRKRIKAFTRQLEGSAAQDTKEYPMVRFHAVDGSQRHLLCVPEEWKAELPTGEVQASRKQLPLILAWALSIHKAQGQTLERVKVDLGKVFEKGQAYVALSRATSQQGLQVLRFEKHKVMAHPRVVQFYNKLYSAEAAVKKKAPSSIAVSGRKSQAGSAEALQAWISTKSGDGQDADSKRFEAYG